MIKKLIIFLAIILTFPFIKVHANIDCGEFKIAETIIELENFDEKVAEKFKKLVSSEIIRQNKIYDKINDLEGSRDYFIKRQDEKYALAFEIIARTLWADIEQKDAKIDDIIKKFEDPSGTGYDIYVINKKKMILKNKQIIDASIMFKSSFLDWLIYSCNLIKIKNNNPLSPTQSPSDFSGNVDANKKFTSREILKYREASAITAQKYAYFVANYKIHKKLDIVIDVLIKLHDRFKDFAKVVWLMPAKLVNFWTE